MCAYRHTNDRHTHDRTDTHMTDRHTHDRTDRQTGGETDTAS